MLALTAFLTVSEGREAEFEALAAALWAETHACEIGIHRYEYVRRAAPGTYLALMLFDDYDAFIVHQASDHHIELAGRMRDLIVELTIEYGDPVIGAFGRPDAASIASRPCAPAPDVLEAYAARYPAPSVVWWR